MYLINKQYFCCEINYLIKTSTHEKIYYYPGICNYPI